MGGPAIARLAPRVHAAWTRDWYAGDPALTALFGAAPSTGSLEQTARAVDAPAPPDHGHWAACLMPEPEAAPVPSDALVVLAGQQPVLAGGPLLVAHKAATAIRLARDLGPSLGRPVIPVFLLATEDHDSSEVDHVDFFDHSNGSLRRVRAGIQPQHEAFFRSAWKAPDVERAVATLTDGRAQLDAKTLSGSFSGHVVDLLRAAFGPLGLRFVEAHRLQAAGAPILARALDEPTALASALTDGARALEALGLRASFDPDDPRPLVLESREGRRRRLEPADAEAGRRQASHPEDFSPHAALRPVVQAAALPVVAQVCGPSEIVYLGQARSLHGLFGVTPPVLVPRLEATRLPDGAGPESLDATDLPGASADLDAALSRLLASVEEFERTVGAADPGLAGKLRRWHDAAARSAGRLAAAPAWRGRSPGGEADALKPRGRPQDTTLSWIAEAWRHGDPAAWGRHIVELCRPLEPPAHVVPHGPASPGDAVGHPSSRESRHG